MKEGRLWTLSKNGTFFTSRMMAILLLVVVQALLPFGAFSQSNTVNVTGLITDQFGDPVIAATIAQKGTTNGAFSDLEGKYVLNNVPENATLVFTYLGMKTVEVQVKGKIVINVLLEEESVLVDEVVVVGYGTQKKVNLTGAVAAITFDEKMSSRSLSSPSLALQGKIAGLAVAQNTGMVGKSDVEVLVRGMGSTNSHGPLIVVDGMPDVDMNRLNMDDIASVSVLKDAASSAVYGSRAANGVILITTKSGSTQSKPKISGSASYTVGKPTHAWEIMAYYPRSLTLHQRDQAVNTLPNNYRFKNGTVDQWMAMGFIDPLRYPNTDWYDVILRDAEIQKYNVSASGGGKESNYYVSLGVLDEKGLLINNDNTRYNARMNYNANIRPNLSIGARFSGSWSEMQYANGANLDGSINANEMRYAIAGMTPYDPVTGYYGGVMAYGEDPQAFNPYSAYTTQLSTQRQQEADVSGFLRWEIIKGLAARVEYSLNYANQFRYQADIPNHSYNFQTDALGSRVYVQDNAGVENYTTTSYKTQMTGQLDYNFNINEVHDFKVMLAYSEEYWHSRNLSGMSPDRYHWSLTDIDGTLGGDTRWVKGSSSAKALRSYIGRANYMAFQRYLFEFNLRADGASQFLDGHRYSYFPSGSVGWILTEEPFLAPLVSSWMSLGKFRVSYGSLGSNAGITNYFQHELLTNLNYILDGKLVKGFVNKKMVNKDLSWERTYVFNLGLDLGFMKNKLSAEIDYYDRLTTDLIRDSDFSIHLSGAYNTPKRNIGKIRNRGIEGNFTWRDKVGKDFKYTINMNASFNATVLEEWSQYLGRGMTSTDSRGVAANLFINMPYDYVYGYEAIGIAQTWEDVYKATPQGAQPGDLLYKDLNGDGKITEDDRRGYSNIQRDRPTTNFALNTSFEWKGFDLAIMLQGAAGRKTYWLVANNNADLMDSRQAMTYDHWNKPWSLENRDSEWTRLGGYNNRKESSFYLDNLAYVRLKNLQVGYSVPQQVLKKIGLTNVRAFFSADNLATITDFRGLDPEKRNINDGYPLMKTFTFGLTLGL